MFGVFHVCKQQKITEAKVSYGHTRGSLRLPRQLRMRILIWCTSPVLIESEPCRTSEARQSLPTRAVFLLAQGPPPPQPQPPAPSPKPTSGSKRDGSRISMHRSERSWHPGHSRSLRGFPGLPGGTWDASAGTGQFPRRHLGMGRACLEQS